MGNKRDRWDLTGQPDFFLFGVYAAKQWRRSPDQPEDSKEDENVVVDEEGWDSRV